MRRLVATKDRPAYLDAMADLLVRQPTLETATALVCRVHARDPRSGCAVAPAQLCLLELRASVSADGRHVCLGCRLTPEVESANEGMDPFYFNLGRALNVDLGEETDLTAHRENREAAAQKKPQKQRRPSLRIAAAEDKAAPARSVPSSATSSLTNSEHKPRLHCGLAEAAALAAADAAAADALSAALPLGSPHTSSFDNQRKYLLERSQAAPAPKSPRRPAPSRRPSQAASQQTMPVSL
jgi:hypothetical protein